ncbi:solute carrier organic anion transporter family member 1C1-like [Sinocyclocheilus rhinocerous]|uniref:solute carrier organic anion transporter family member 1C1-like n=1 Tax=Sinocyclocheilus rhinocerous TaxID=307959 RepID=UPI0007B81314|nr:PREDICTED: solute carrier organic anion transporter family member 1C1-like [Sinocyclocheilus rhinocerous]
MSVEKKTAREPCCSKLKMFLAAMGFVYFAKAFQGSYMKSSVTQIERRFDIPSSLIGFIDGSFEIGNLFVIAFVSYFGAKLHRPRLIGAGCLIMAIGSFITAAPHFFQGPYKYETSISHFSASNDTESILPCLTNGSLTHDNEIPTVEIQAGCEKAASSSLWLYVFLGNMLRGVGETPVMPLGLSYLDDFSREENTALYMSLVQTLGIMGPVFGFMLGSFCAKLYVDIGAVDLDTITINYKDSRWVGAWGLGFLLTGGVMLLAGIPFWFFPKSLPKQGETETEKKSNVLEGEQDRFIPDNNKHSTAPNKPASMAVLAKGVPYPLDGGAKRGGSKDLDARVKLCPPLEKEGSSSGGIAIEMEPVFPLDEFRQFSIEWVCLFVRHVIMLTESNSIQKKRDALHWEELALLPVDLKPKLTKVPEHQVPVLAKQISRMLFPLGTYEIVSVEPVFPLDEFRQFSIEWVCLFVRHVIMLTESNSIQKKRDALHWEELALLPVDLKPKLTKVPEHQVPVLAKQISRGTHRYFGEDVGSKGYPKKEDFVLVCLTLESKAKKRSVLSILNGSLCGACFKTRRSKISCSPPPFLGIMNLPAVALGIITGGFIMKKFKLNVLGATKICTGTSLLAFSSMLIQYFLQCDNSQVAGLTVSYHGKSSFVFIGIMNLPAVALGIITGGFIMKKFKLNVLGATKICTGTSLLAFSSLLIQYFLQCDNSQVAGLTVSYHGAPQVSYQQNTLISSCNMGCSCSLKHWDPICASNGLTYASPCLAGCQTSTGDGRDMVFHNCTCIGESPLPFANMSSVLGQCPRKSDCDYMFKFYMAVTVIGAFLSACGATPGYIILLRTINPELKSLALGIYILIVRTLGGIPPPIYFGALIDRTCLKWGTKQCGGRGACRIYDSGAFRNAFLGLIYGLYSLSYVLWGILYNRLSHREKKLALKNQLKAPEQDDNGVSSGNGNVSSAIVKCSENPDQETTI